MALRGLGHRRQLRHLQAIIFDMDGVLLRSMPMHYAAWRRAGASLGLPVSRSLIFQHEGEPGATTTQWLAPPALRRELLARKERHYARTKRGVRPYAGAAGLLRNLQRGRWRLGLVTGTSRRELRATLPVTLRRVFDASVTGDEVRRGKPHPEPYRRICRLLRVAPAQVLVVENAPFGIRSAQRAGIRLIAALTTTVNRRQLAGATQVFGSVRALAAWCRRIHLTEQAWTVQELQCALRRG